MAILSSGTVLLYNRAARNSGRLIRLDELYSKYYGLHSRTRAWNRAFETRLHAYNEQNKTVSLAAIAEIRRLEREYMFSITIDGNSSATNIGARTLLRTRRGVIDAASVRSGIKVLCKGSMRPVGGNGRAARHHAGRVTIGSLKYYSGGWRDDTIDPKTQVVYQYRRSHRARLVIEASINQLDLQTYISRLRTDPAAASLSRLPDDVDVHHIDQNPMNDDLSNLEVLSKRDHALLHQCDERRFGIEYFKWGLVNRVERKLLVPYYVGLVQYTNVAVAGGLIVFD